MVRCNREKEIKKLIPLFKKVAFHCPNGSDKYFTDVEDGVLEIFFPGATDAASVLCFLTLKAAKYEDTGIQYTVHEGVLYEWRLLKNNLVETLKQATQGKVRIVGYSFGGAMAYLCHDLALSLGLDVSTIVFESPKIFKKIPRNAVSRFRNIIHVKMNRSPVSMMMPRILGFRNPKTICTIKLKPVVGNISIVNHMDSSVLYRLESDLF